MVMGGMPPMSEVHLRVLLREVRSKCTQNGDGQSGEMVVDSALINTVRRQKSLKPICTPCRICLAIPATIVVGFILFAFVLPVYHEPSAGYVTRTLGDLSFPALRVVRKLALPLKSYFPELESMYSEQCIMNNPYYVEDAQEGEDTDTPYWEGEPAGRKSQKNKKKASPLDKFECSCLGVRAAGRVKNRDQIKLKHLLDNPGRPLLLTLPKTFTNLSLEDLFSIPVDVLAENLCHFEPKKDGERCTNLAVNLFNSLQKNASGITSSGQSFAWTYCPYSSAVDALLKWLNPHSYLVGNNVKISRYTSIMLGKMDDKELVPLPLPLEYELHAVHQVFGERKYFLEPVDCKKCKDLTVTLKPGQALFYDSGVWAMSVDNPNTADWSIVFTYSVERPGAEIVPYDEPGNCA